MIRTLAAFELFRRGKKKQLQTRLRVSVLLVVWLTVTGGIVLSGDSVNGKTSLPVKVIVGSGDTLWGLAKEYAPRGMDLRDYLAKVLQKNELTDVLVYPGQEIILP